MAVKVTLRQKKLKDDKISLYLDFYPPVVNPKTGKPTRRQFLRLYIFKKPKSVIDKLHNKETLLLANQIRLKKDNLLNKPEVYSDFEKEQLRIKELGEQSFLDYFKKLMRKRQNSNYDNWSSAYNYLEKFCGDELKFADVTEKFCEDFKEFLLTTNSNKSDKSKLAVNSAVSYFNKFKATLKQAFKDGFFQVDINSRVSSIKAVDSKREFLTLEELNSLVHTPCNNSLLKRAALFSALTGLRFSDIQKLKWSEIEYIKDKGYYLKFNQKKTNGYEMLPISDQAYSFLGEPGEYEDQVFTGLRYSAHENKHLYQWIGAAGITKNITFHCFRHTYASLQLLNGTDIYTVSKLLGHKNLSTTQIYAKVVDEAKRKAANRIKLDL